jgi:hypothetical protein
VIVCLHLDPDTGYVAGAWWELPDDELDFVYVDSLTTTALVGIDRMNDRPPGMDWPSYWSELMTSDLTESYRIVEVDDESYGYELLYHLETCHPSPVGRDVGAWLARCEEDPDLVQMLLRQLLPPTRRAPR